MAKIVNDFGDLVRMSEHNYRRFIKAGVAGANPTASKYGKVIGQIAFTATDADKSDYEMAAHGLDQ